jgi:hypothetical protein
LPILRLGNEADLSAWYGETRSFRQQTAKGSTLSGETLPVDSHLRSHALQKSPIKSPGSSQITATLGILLPAADRHITFISMISSWGLGCRPRLLRRSMFLRHSDLAAISLR